MVLPSRSYSAGGFLIVLVTFESQQNTKMWQIQISTISSTCKTWDIFWWPHLVYQSHDILIVLPSYLKNHFFDSKIKNKVSKNTPNLFLLHISTNVLRRVFYLIYIARRYSRVALCSSVELGKCYCCICVVLMSTCSEYYD